MEHFTAQPLTPGRASQYEPPSTLISSRQVNATEVYLFVDRMLKQLGIKHFPAAGIPAWSALDDDDPAKLAGVLVYAAPHAWQIEQVQEAVRDASRAISTAVDWSAVAQEIRTRQGSAYIRRVTQ